MNNPTIIYSIHRDIVRALGHCWCQWRLYETNHLVQMIRYMSTTSFAIIYIYLSYMLKNLAWTWNILEQKECFIPCHHVKAYTNTIYVEENGSPYQTSVCRIDLDVVYRSSHFPFKRSELSGSFNWLAASSLRAIWTWIVCVNMKHLRQKVRTQIKLSASQANRFASNGRSIHVKKNTESWSKNLFNLSKQDYLQKDTYFRRLIDKIKYGHWFTSQK